MKSFVAALAVVATLAMPTGAHALGTYEQEQDMLTVDQMSDLEAVDLYDAQFRPGRPGRPGRPYPPHRPPHRPPPNRGGYTQYVDCDSWNYAYASCYVGGNIRSARVVSQRSTGRGQCIYGSSWGYNYNQIWVSNGCRATFQVDLY